MGVDKVAEISNQFPDNQLEKAICIVRLMAVAIGISLAIFERNSIKGNIQTPHYPTMIQRVLNMIFDLFERTGGVSDSHPWRTLTIPSQMWLILVHQINKDLRIIWRYIFEQGFVINDQGIALKTVEEVVGNELSSDELSQFARFIVGFPELRYVTSETYIKDIKAEVEETVLEYIIRDPELYRNKRVVISGGGDSALDWAIFLTNVASEVSLVHRRNEFRGALDSVEKVSELAKSGKINLITDAEVKDIHGEGAVKSVMIKHKTEGEIIKECDHFIPLFGLTPKLGPIADWGLEIEKNAIKVNNALDYSTNIPGIYAVGDVNIYPGKLKLILCGFHEATIALQYAYKRINPDKRYVMKYTTVGGVTGFDGTVKEAQKSVVARINTDEK